MSRNFFRRVEALFPVQDAELKKRISDVMLPAELRDNEDARLLRENGAYDPPPRADGAASFVAQRYFIESAQTRADVAAVTEVAAG